MQHETSFSLESIKKLLRLVGFTPTEGKNAEWEKTYQTFQSRVTVSFGKTSAETRVNYGQEIMDKSGRSTTHNFSQPESLVVLECVNRLLDLGYAPGSITLEKQYPVGHTHGWLDVLVSENGSPYLMIECKQWGHEFDKEKSLFLSNGGQLLSYFHQDKSAKFITLYSSRPLGDGIETKYCAVDTQTVQGDSVAELFKAWDKSYFETGVFDGLPYQIEEKRLTKGDLEDMTASDGGKIFNEFAEILRRYVVSDKPNAFNKMFNLFICKVQDEEKKDAEVLDFQWQGGETAEAVLNRLNDLYKQGMKQYLRMEIADHTEAEINHRLSAAASEADKSALYKIYTELRLYKNNEFAFKEVFDKKTFDANSEVVREVVRLLQKKRLRYTHKQQFLGDFFERLLNTSVKQEAGQFFTPIPMARFICDSLPLQAIIDQKLKDNEANFLPYMIDYASGSGHFLTEGMDRIDHMVKAIDPAKLRLGLKSNLRKWSEDYAWADEFVYGIEKDYRLAKTAKVSCFLNGDGEANVICADGLDSFTLSQEYQGRLKLHDIRQALQDNPVFDVLVANPPYSVAACKNTVTHGEKSFTLWPRLTEQSSEIECLFLERAKQLLKLGGVAGIILPSSILSNGGIYEETREMVLKYFKIVSIAVMGGSTFMATGTNTVVLFLKRRADDDWKRVMGFVDAFFGHWQDMAVLEQENAFSLYAQTVWGLSLADLCKLLDNRSDKPVHPLYDEYKTAYGDLPDTRRLKESKSFQSLSEEGRSALLEERFQEFFKDLQKEKMLYFLLAGNQPVVIARAPSDRASEKEFLGYEFSSRKGSEGLSFLSGTNKISSALYNQDDDNDPEKINSLIRANFLGQALTVPHVLEKYVTVAKLQELMDFDQVRFDKSIRTSKKKVVKSNWPLARLGSVADISSGGTPDTNTPEFWDGEIKWATIEDVKQKYLTDTRRKLTPLGAAHAGPILPVNTVLFSSRATIGEVSITRAETTTNQGFKNFVVHPDKLNVNYLFHVLKSQADEMRASCAGMTYPEISASRISDWRIPLPPLETQVRIAKRLDKTDCLEARRKERVLDTRAEIFQLLSACQGMALLHDLCLVSHERVEPVDFSDRSVNYVGMEHILEGTGTSCWNGPVDGGSIKSTKNVFHKGDVLYGKLRPYLNKVWVADFDGVCSTELVVLRPRIEPDLLKYVLLSPSFVEQAQSHARGLHLPRVASKTLLRIPVPDVRGEEDGLVAVIKAAETSMQREREKIESLKAVREVYLKEWHD